PAGLDALVLGGSIPQELIAPFIAAKKPVLWVDEVYDADIRCVVGMDHFEAGRLAADHLLSRGKRAIVAMGYPVGSYKGFELRLEGYRRAHADHGVPIDERRILRPYYSRVEHVIEILRQLKSDGVPYDAVFGLSDAVGMWNVSALGRMGVRVPQEVAV